MKIYKIFVCWLYFCFVLLIWLFMNIAHVFHFYMIFIGFCFIFFTCFWIIHHMWLKVFFIFNDLLHCFGHRLCVFIFYVIHSRFLSVLLFIRYAVSVAVFNFLSLSTSAFLILGISFLAIFFITIVFPESFLSIESFSP